MLGSDTNPTGLPKPFQLMLIKGEHEENHKLFKGPRQIKRQLGEGLAVPFVLCDWNDWLLNADILENSA